MQQRDRDVLEHMIRYCDRIAGYLNKLENVWNTMMIDLPVLKQKCQSSLDQK